MNPDCFHQSGVYVLLTGTSQKFLFSFFSEFRPFFLKKKAVGEVERMSLIAPTIQLFFR